MQNIVAKREYGVTVFILHLFLNTLLNFHFISIVSLSEAFKAQRGTHVHCSAIINLQRSKVSAKTKCP